MTALTTLEAPVATREAHRSIPMSRILGVELRKMFDTRSGFWLLVSVGVFATLATVAVILVAPRDELTYETFATAIGFPMAVILPMIAILSVTSEWSQRTGLTTFTLVPSRGRVIAAKWLDTVAIGVVSMLVAGAVGAVGNVVGTAIAGVDTSWNVSLPEYAMIILANVLGMMVGFTLGVLFRNSAAAIVGYFVFSLLLPAVSGALAASQAWFRDARPWVDWNYAQSALFNGVPSSEQWAHLGVASLIWLGIPLAIGLWLVLRSEVK
ncbi:MAG TPA: ABC transporter permease [Marmoricola sp.]|nr:ABC transporter permease [Marmoricola sp.]